VCGRKMQFGYLRDSPVQSLHGECMYDGLAAMGMGRRDVW
jgi:hypothetical protein